MENILITSVVKWAGGKKNLLPVIKSKLPTFTETSTYFEPFIGGGALFLELLPSHVVINDYNEELINVYEIIRVAPKELIKELKSYNNSEEFYHKLRELDRNIEKYSELTEIERAARLLFLNKTCFNGLYRVNSKNQFNVPFGKYKNPNFVNEDKIMHLHHYLEQCDIRIISGDFERAISTAKKNDFVYFDPPYDPINQTSSFTTYSTSNFNKSEQVRLRDVALNLAKNGVNVMLSNNDTDFIRDIYKMSPFTIYEVDATRNIGASAKSRGKIQELLITTY